jgi:HlyD family secretion protein
MQIGSVKFGIALVVLGGLFWLAKEGVEHASVPVFAQAGPKILAAAPGRIEGSSETIAVGVSTSGIIQEIFVREGDHVAKDQLLARIDCSEISAEIPERAAQFAAATAVFEKLKNGSRPEDIAIADADLRLANARLTEAEATKQRNTTLLSSQVASLAQSLTAERDAGMASAQVKIAEERLALLKAGPRFEEIAEAKARAESAEHAVDVAKARLAKCEVRSPIDGTILRKYVSDGELFSIYNPQPLFSLAATDRYRVRAEVDENDIGSVYLGQTVSVVVDPSTNRRLSGTVVELGSSMGRRKILTTDAADKGDRDVLEVAIDIQNDGQLLPIGLRVAVIFQAKS